MSKVSELNKLAQKITGQNPKENTIREILDFISSFFKGSKVKSSNTEKAIKNVTNNYKGGGSSTKPIVPKGEELSGALSLQFLENGVDKAYISDTEAAFFEQLDFSQCTSFISMFANTFITHGPEMDTSSGENFNEMFKSCESLVSVPQYDFSHGIGAMGVIDAFRDCTNLVTVPNLIRTPNSPVYYLENMFNGCESLSDESLNNIMAMCINCPNAEYKELAYVGLSEEQAVRCQSLSNYQSLIAAGWTTGY